MHALNKRYALNTEVRLTTRVYGKPTYYIIAILKKTDSLLERMYMHNTNDIGIYLINDVVIFTFRKLGYIYMEEQTLATRLQYRPA